MNKLLVGIGPRPSTPTYGRCRRPIQKTHEYGAGFQLAIVTEPLPVIIEPVPVIIELIARRR